MEILYKFSLQFRFFSFCILPFKDDLMQSDHTRHDNTSDQVILQLLEDLRVEDTVKEVEK